MGMVKTAIGWRIPPLSNRVTKTDVDFEREREAMVRRMVRRLVRRALLRSTGIAEAMGRVPKERFVPLEYRDCAYQELPLPRREWERSNDLLPP